MMYRLYFDGASRNNPGPAGYGGVIIDEDDNECFTYYDKFDKPQTNNYAEYFALYAGLSLAIKNNIKNLTVYGDSNLVIQQMNKKWKVKSKNLKGLFNKCSELVEQFNIIIFQHVLRKYNKRADELANMGLDS